MFSCHVIFFSTFTASKEYPCTEEVNVCLIYLSSSSKSHMKTHRKKKISLFFFLNGFFLSIGTAEGNVMGIPALSPTCHIRHPPGRPGKKHRWWWEEDALQEDEDGCVKHESSAKATSAWLFLTQSRICLSPWHDCTLRCCIPLIIVTGQLWAEGCSPPSFRAQN